MAERRLALVVATDRYDDGTLRGLAAPAADAEALADALGDPELGGFEVDVLSNATSWVVAEHVDGLLGERRSSDLVLLHFSCHGLKDESGELYLAATNTRPDRLATTAVDAALVNRLMRRSRAQRVVVFLDCCYGGAFERGVVARAGGDVHVGEQFAPESLGGGRGRVVITASSAMEYAFEGNELTLGGRPAPSLFTSALVDGIRTGAADRDQDGNVSLDELYDHVHDTVQARTPNQTPSRWEFGVQGEMVIARNPHRVVLPPDLVERIGSSSVDDRLGAVEELGQMSRDATLGLAAGAVAALAPLVDDDSRRVAQAAQAALEAIVPRPEKSIVDLGRVTCGQAAHVQVRVKGGPLAMSSTVQTSGPEVEARLGAGRLSLQVVAEQPGPVTGSVTLLGPAGEARVDIAGEAVVPGPTPIEPITPTPRSPGSNLAVVVPLVLLGAAAISAAWYWKVDTPDTRYGETIDLLLMPAFAGLLAAACLAWRRLVPFAVGILAGAAAWAVIFWAKNTMGGAAAGDGLFRSSDGELLTAHWARLVGGVLLGVAVAMVLKASPDLRARVSRRPGSRSALAGVVVLAGVLVPIIALRFQRAGVPEVVVTEWLFVLAVCLPVAFLQLNVEQRRAALVGVGALCLFTVVRNMWVIAADQELHRHLAVAVVAAAVVMAGCLLGQARPRNAQHGPAPHPPGIVAPG